MRGVEPEDHRSEQSGGQEEVQRKRNFCARARLLFLAGVGEELAAV